MQPYSDNEIDQLASSYGKEVNTDVEAALRAVRDRIDTTNSSATVRQMPRRSRWLGIAAAILLLVSVGYFGLMHNTDVVYANQGVAPLEVVLPDGSTVLIQQGATLSYAQNFNDTERRVNLDGQAFFQVEKNQAKPFLVANASTELRVTGTAFNLRVTEDELEVEVSEGAVELKSDQDVVPVKANQLGRSVGGQPSSVTPAPFLNRHAWRTGKLYFQAADFFSVLETLEANFGVVVTVEGDCSFEVSGTFAADNPTAILQNVVKLGGGKLEAKANKKNHFTVTDICN